MASQTATIGRIVRYRDNAEIAAELPAIITWVGSENEVNLQVFRTNDVVARLSVPFNDQGADRSWRWPDRS